MQQIISKDIANVSSVKELLVELFPLLRSITGEGVRKTFDILEPYIPLERIEIETGRKIGDWTVPREWVVRNAYIIRPDGQKICDIKKNNLHLINYSVPVDKQVSKKELDEHLYSIEEIPEAIPYITSYYKERWGFCIQHKERQKLPDGDYKVVIDTSFIDGSMTLGEVVLKGQSDKEIVFTAYICHPSMANDQLSGPVTLALLYQELKKQKKLRFTYRFIFVPETIGSIAYLELRGKTLKERMIAGYVVALTGGKGPFVYRHSRKVTSLADSIALRVLNNENEHEEIMFNPSRGNDQRQFCSPGYNLPMGSLTYTPIEKDREYHNSLDNLENLSISGILDTLRVCKSIINSFEDIELYINLKPNGEPFLSKYDLYSDLGNSSSFNSNNELTQAIMWLLNYSDGQYDLSMISELSKIKISLLRKAANICLNKTLISKI